MLLLVLMVAPAAWSAGARANPEAAEASEAADLEPLTIGLMPAVDSVPLIVADASGYTKDEGLAVTLEVFRDQRYREAALQSGAVDITVSDLVNVIRAWENGADYRVVASTQGVFSVLTAPGSGVTAPERWPKAPATLRTGLLEESIINYTAQRMLTAAGLDYGRIEIVPTTQIPVRLEMLNAGELDAAVLPEPVTRMATAAGSHEIVSTDVLDWTPGVLVATGTALREKPRELEALLRAYDRAVEAVNADPDAYRAIIVERAGFPPPTAETMRIPAYRPAALPTAAQVGDVAEWMVEQGLIEAAPPYEEIVRERPFDE
jgi:NitT/TauT family transport system substrate-binding protein